jgi:hypothetical protein
MLVSGLFIMRFGFPVMVACLCCHGLLLVDGSRQYAEKTASGLVRIAQCQNGICQTAGRDACTKIQQEDGNLGRSGSTHKLERGAAGLGAADIGPASSNFQTEHFGSVPIRLRVQHGRRV